MQLPLSSVPAIRVCDLNNKQVIDTGSYVLYWMTSARRTGWNFGLQRAVDWSTSLKKPLVILEAVRCDYQWASDRFHAFIIQGMIDNDVACKKAGVTYLPYIEPKRHAARGLLAMLASTACVVVGDDYPAFFLRRMLRAAAPHMPCRFEVIDSNGLLPLSVSEKASYSAYIFRRFLQKNLPDHLVTMPDAIPLARLPRFAQPTFTAIKKKWPMVTDIQVFSAALKKLPIDHSVGIVTTNGGQIAAKKQLRVFIKNRLSRYDTDRNSVDNPAASGLSPWLHFGHLSAHEIVAAVLKQEEWSPDHLSSLTNGKREGWWGLSAATEAFFDELITWREVGYHYCHHQPQHESFENLPAWAQKTLNDHADDPREYAYTLDEFADAQTHDPLWNAAQRELRQTGIMHNYLRMLWGKKIIEWTRHPREALAIMTELNNRYALDGRDPNSSSGISWCLGRFDRPWAPQRPIFGSIRFMSSASTMKKLKLKQYLQQWGE